MIRINLLGVERKQTRRAAAFDIGKRVTLACSLILVVAAAGIAFWYWSLNQASAKIDADIVDARQQQARLNSIIAETAQFEARRAQLQQRVALIERLRTGQGLPVQLLDQVSASVPDMLWLLSMEQGSASDVSITGRATTMIALSDFVANLGNSSFFKKPVEIIESKAERDATGFEIVQFRVKAQLAGDPASASKR